MDEDIRKQLKAIDLTKRFDKLVKYRVSTGIEAFDRVIGGGIPSGRLTEFFGGESTYKSWLVCRIIAEVQKAGGVAVLNDTEKCLDKGLVALTGVDLNSGTLIYPDPEEITSVEDVYDSLKMTVEVVRPKYPDKPVAFIWDSIAATPGDEDIDKPLGRNEAGMRRAKLIGEGLQKYLPAVYKNQIILIFVNQIRDKMNVMFGNKTDTPGGRMIKFLASVRIGMKVIGSIRDEQTKEQVGTKLELLVRKSKVSPPFGVVNFELPVFEPISRYAGLLDYMVRHGEATRSGTWYGLPGYEKKFQAKDFEEHYEEWLKKDDTKQSTTTEEKTT